MASFCVVCLVLFEKKTCNYHLFETLILNYCIIIIIRLHDTNCEVSAAHVVMFNGPSALHLRHVTFLHRSAEPQGLRRRSHREKSFRFSGPIFVAAFIFLHTEIAVFFGQRKKGLPFFLDGRSSYTKPKSFFRSGTIFFRKNPVSRFFWYYAMTQSFHML